MWILGVMVIFEIVLFSCCWQFMEEPHFLDNVRFSGSSAPRTTYFPGGPTRKKSAFPLFSRVLQYLICTLGPNKSKVGILDPIIGPISQLKPTMFWTSSFQLSTKIEDKDEGFTLGILCGTICERGLITSSLVIYSNDLSP